MNEHDNPSPFPVDNESPETIAFILCQTSLSYLDTPQGSSSVKGRKLSRLFS